MDDMDSILILETAIARFLPIFVLFTFPNLPAN